MRQKQVGPTSSTSSVQTNVSISEFSLSELNTTQNFNNNDSTSEKAEDIELESLNLDDTENWIYPKKLLEKLHGLIKEKFEFDPKSLKSYLNYLKNWLIFIKIFIRSFMLSLIVVTYIIYYAKCFRLITREADKTVNI